MRQYNEIKAAHPEAILLFRVGDFYETFGEDAVTASQILGIVLTKRSNGAASETALAGFPHHSLQTYLPKLVKAGQRVAICDQLEDPKLTKKIVKRGVTELVTPGITYSDQILQGKSNNYLAAVQISKQKAGLSLVDVSTGEFYVAQGPILYIDRLLQSFAPKELLLAKPSRNKVLETFAGNWYEFGLEDWVFQSDYGYEIVTGHFKTQSLKGFGIEEMDLAIPCAGAILHYLSETRNNKVDHITALQRIVEDDFMWMDRFTQRNLELFHSNSPDGISLREVIDHTVSPMGGRLLTRWLAMPLKDQKAIEARLEKVKILTEQFSVSQKIREVLEGLYDVERLASKVSTGKVNPRELLQVKTSIEGVKKIDAVISPLGKPFKVMMSNLPDLSDLESLITQWIMPEPAVLITKGGVIAEGQNAELDEYRDLLTHGKDKLKGVQERESEASGISSLKLAYNNVFGYYLEVRNTHKDKVPEGWIRKQTLVNAERYITEELKEWEAKILGAEEKALALEMELYQKLLNQLIAHVQPLQKAARLLGELDVYTGFSQLAKKNKYVEPTFHDGDTFVIEAGRHPVIEKALPTGQAYIPNSLELNDEQQIMMITGPNMSGKSALLRQTALISILAQMGCFVPAKSAHLPIIEKVFVRVGASDNISQGESTFMVEMNETASILNSLSRNSLVLLDEIGRGTSTFDGISIAWAIAEFLHEHPARPKTLFATHYHELNEMEKQFERIVNYSVSIKESKNQIVFMRKLVPGGSEHSFGIHVAQMAGMPSFVVSKAQKVLKNLENTREQKPSASSDEMQLSFFQLDDPLLEDIKEDITELDIDTLTPVEALMFLSQIKKKLGGND
ncbi:MAG: DNA mismatch repair protein MutS [Schleiferiaceae bacterium]